MHDVGRQPIGHVYETIRHVECPVCTTRVLVHRVQGLGLERDLMWFTLWPHAAPCGLRCIAGGIFERPVRKVDGVHGGPTSCHRCQRGYEDKNTASPFIPDSVGDMELEWGTGTLRSGASDTNQNR